MLRTEIFATGHVHELGMGMGMGMGEQPLFRYLAVIKVEASSLTK